MPRLQAKKPDVVRVDDPIRFYRVRVGVTTPPSRLTRPGGVVLNSQLKQISNFARSRILEIMGLNNERRTLIIYSTDDPLAKAIAEYIASDEAATATAHRSCKLPFVPEFVLHPVDGSTDFPTLGVFSLQFRSDTTRIDESGTRVPDYKVAITHR